MLGGWLTCYLCEFGKQDKIDSKMRFIPYSLILTFFFGFNLSLKAQERISLFNGADLEGWHMDVPDLEVDSSLRVPFIIREGLLVSLGTPEGHLITDEVYDNYELELDYRFAGEPGNCGILVHASEPRALYKMFPKSIEVQLMHQNAGDFWCIQENIEVENMVDRRGPKENWGVKEGKERRILNLTDDSEKSLGEWNHVKVRCQENEVTVWVNGDLVNHGFNASTSSGQIALQAEGAEVEFKNIFLNSF